MKVTESVLAGGVVPTSKKEKSNIRMTNLLF